MFPARSICVIESVNSELRPDEKVIFVENVPPLHVTVVGLVARFE